MTSISRMSARCGVCGQWQQVSILASTNTLGARDLDGRPAQMKRSTMSMWTMQCGHCGYVAEDLNDTADPTAAELVRSPAYALERACSTRPALANRFICGALLKERAGKLDEAAWQRVYAAWALDDDGRTGEAMRERALAVTLFDANRANGDLDRLATRVDLARRSGMLGRAYELAVEGIERATELSDHVQRMRAGFILQQRLVQAGDVGCYTWDAVDDTPLAPAAPLILPEPPVDVLDVVDLDGVKLLPYIPRSLIIGSRAWKLVGELEMLNAESERRHAFATSETTDAYRARQKLKYPCGTTLEDTGRAHVGGRSTYTIHDLTPGLDVLVVRRTDYIYGDYEVEMIVDGVSVGRQLVLGTDRVHRWRNWPFVIPGARVSASSIVVEQVARTAGRDVNMFHYWFLQPDD